MKLIVATTPFNIFNAILLKENFLKNEKVDLYITDFSTYNLFIAKKIREETQLFNFVTIIKQYKYDHAVTLNNNKLMKKFFIKAFLKFKRTFFKKQCYKAVCGFVSKEKYDEIFIDVGNYPQRVVMDYHYSRNKKMKTNLYEVGNETFLLASQFDKSSGSAESNYRKARYKNLRAVYVHNLYGFPSLIRNIEMRTFGKIEDETKALLNIAFDYKDEYAELLNNDFIYLDSSADDDMLLEEKFIELFQKMQNITNRAFCVKLHPRTESNLYGEDSKCYNIPIPFEVLLLNCKDIDKKVFVSHCSVATLTPKVVFDFEPTVIQFNKFVRGQLFSDYWVSCYDRIVRNAKSQYRNPEKFMQPNTEEEFIKIIQNEWQKRQEN